MEETAGEKTERQLANEAKRLAKLEKFKAKQDKLAQEKAEQSAKAKDSKVTKRPVGPQEAVAIPVTPAGEKKGIFAILFKKFHLQFFVRYCDADGRHLLPESR